MNKPQLRLERLLAEKKEHDKKVEEIHRERKRLNNAIAQARYYIRTQESKKNI